MAERPTSKNDTGLNTSSPLAAGKSPDTDISPHTKTSSSAADDYFSASSASDRPPQPLTTSSPKAPNSGVPDAASPPNLGAPSSGASTITATSSLHSSEGKTDTLPSRQASDDSSDRPLISSRKSSTASVTFRPPCNPSLPQGIPRKTDNKRLRHSSPEPVKFRQHVGFDNLPAGEATKNNPSSFTLQARHQGYQSSRRSRTFMIGVEEHAYSDYALVWLLTHMVDDGDEVVCVRVVENGIRPGDKTYQDEAKRLLKDIQSKNEHNKAISIILEYSVGKLHDTFQQLLGMYNPSMLVVGTKGRSLGGLQGLMNTRNSFSKYCLQYSPIPVVVVRPNDKRAKKKEKRTHDPSRQNYASMLKYNDGRHEADSETTSIYELEKTLSPDEEAHRVAAAIGLPARFDPTIKPYNPGSNSASNSRRSSPSGLPSPSIAMTTSVSLSPAAPQTDSGDEDGGDDDNNDDESGDDEEEFEAVSGQQIVGARKQTEFVKEQEQKKRLHDMEVGEAAALLKSQQQLEEEEEDDESQERTSG